MWRIEGQVWRIKLRKYGGKENFNICSLPVFFTNQQCFSCFISLNLHPDTERHLISILQRRKRSLRRLWDSPRVPQLVSVWIQIQTQTVWLLKSSSGSTVSRSEHEIWSLPFPSPLLVIWGFKSTGIQRHLESPVTNVGGECSAECLEHGGAQHKGQLMKPERLVAGQCCGLKGAPLCHPPTGPGEGACRSLTC